jgi:hypothetical protein
MALCSWRRSWPSAAAKISSQYQYSLSAAAKMAKISKSVMKMPNQYRKLQA